MKIASLIALGVITLFLSGLFTVLKETNPPEQSVICVIMPLEEENTKFENDCALHTKRL